jgi:N-methylhydantoinase A
VNAVLSRINAANPIGLKHLDALAVEGARAAIGELGRGIGLGVEATAEAILTIVNQRMAGRTRLLSVEQGHDPRDFVLVVFGGAGPLHGAAIMREVGIRTMLIPPHPGVLCALGCAIADLRYDLSRTIERRAADLTTADIQTVLAEQRDEGERQFRESDAPAGEIVAEHAAQMSYAGQIHTLRVPVQADWELDRMVSAFHDVYHAEYGNTLGNIPVTIVSLKTAVRGRRAAPSVQRAEAVAPIPARPVSYRPVYFGGWRNTPIYDRAMLRPGHMFDGPAILEQADTTSVIEPGMHARVDAFGNVLVEMR